VNKVDSNYKYYCQDNGWNVYVRAICKCGYDLCARDISAHESSRMHKYYMSIPVGEKYVYCINRLGQKIVPANKYTHKAKRVEEI
jgi:hypothetical protein